MKKVNHSDKDKEEVKNELIEDASIEEAKNYDDNEPKSAEEKSLRARALGGKNDQ